MTDEQYREGLDELLAERAQLRRQVQALAGDLMCVADALGCEPVYDVVLKTAAEFRGNHNPGLVDALIEEQNRLVEKVGALAKERDALKKALDAFV